MLQLTLPGTGFRNCDGVSRRHLLRVGASGLLTGVSLPGLLAAGESTQGRLARAKACIFIFLEGGPPHQDMWDPKPQAPAEIRGPFGTIPTAVPGTFFAEH